MKPLFSVKVRVPATTANLGPSFDVLGLALTFYNEVSLVGRPSGPPLTIVNEGEGASTLPMDRRHLLFQAAARAFKRAGRALPRSMELRLLNRIPLARGLGSSSAAIVGGIVAANAAMGGPLSPEKMLELSTEIEGHPDNVAPALFGGLVTSVVHGGRVACVPWKDKALFNGLKFVVAVPAFELSTAKARAMLPVKVSRQDAVFNVGRAALFLAALKERRYDLLAVALEDRLHQPYRKRLIPGFDAVLTAARKSGAFGACLSGAGPAMLAITPAARATAVSHSMVKAFAAHRVAGLTMVLDVDYQGACVAR